MLPVLFKIGPLTLHTYGVLLAAAYLTGMWVVVRSAREAGADVDRVLDWMFWGIVGAILGARLLYVVVNLPHYAAHPIEIVQVWKGGLVFYGGVFGGFVAAMLYLLPRHLPAWQWADFVAPALALGQGVGRMGCLAAGCCYGKPTEVAWAIHFHNPAALAPLDVALHPTQFYDSLCGLAIFAILWLFRRHKQFDGQLMLLYLFLYTVARSTVELFRGDQERGLFFGGHLSISQLISLVLLSIAALLYWHRSRTAARPARARHVHASATR